MNDLDCTPEQKLKGAVYLLRDEAYQWWQTVEHRTQPERVTWVFFRSAFQNKYVGVRYIEALRHEFIRLTLGERSVVGYVRSLVDIDYDKNVRFEEGLKYDIKLRIGSESSKLWWRRRKSLRKLSTWSARRGIRKGVRIRIRGIWVLLFLFNDL
ncbi:ATP-dependent zinc metalloprotease FtsH [Gossypium australe]|uniref:ATP-dependent zinc metalloprotease FtsH n=1 Tax=Gossypium australe TaxID=47621 RepID=A0A5B6VKZ6_9ROSI|nr:ATP-dependent zinc metalloprotease FtsH [Gossypium australe]